MILTKLKLYDLEGKEQIKKEIKTELRIIGSILVALSGLILFSDKVTNFEFENNFGFSDTDTFLWVLSQTISPVLIIIASIFKPYKTSYLIPIYIYTIQLYWVFQPNARFDNIYLQAYAIGTCMLFLLLSYVILKINSIERRRELEKKQFQIEANEMIELLKKEILSTSK